MIVSRTLILQVAAAFAVGASLFVFGHAIASAPGGEGRRLGLRGLKREQSLERSEMWRFFEPIVRWLGLRVSRFVPLRLREALDARIGGAGDFMGLLPEELVGMCVLTGVLGLGIGYAIGALSGVGALATIGGLTGGLLMPILQLWDNGNTRLKDVNRRLPGSIDLLGLGMGAGLDFPSSIRQVVEKAADPTDPLIEEFSLVLQSLQLGRTRQQALTEFASRADTEPVREFVAAVVQAELRGNPLANVLKLQAEVSRQRRAIRAEEAAGRAGVVMVLPLTLVFVTIMILVVSPLIMKINFFH